MGLSFSEIAIVLVIALLVFGPKQLPQIAQTLGRTLGELRRTIDDLKFEVMRPQLDEQPDRAKTNLEHTSGEETGNAQEHAPVSLADDNNNKDAH